MYIDFLVRDIIIAAENETGILLLQLFQISMEFIQPLMSFELLALKSPELPEGK